MKFYNLREIDESACLFACWTSDIDAIHKKESEFVKRGKVVTVEARNMPKFAGTPNLDAFAHWEYSPGEHTFSLCLNRNRFPVASRGILAEINTEVGITYKFSALAYQGLFGIISAGMPDAQKADLIEDALCAIERGVIVQLKHMQNQLNSLLESTQEIFI